MALTKKVLALFTLMERFLTQKEISSYDAILLDEFGCDKKTLERYLKEIESCYTHIIAIQRGKQNVWKLISVSDIFREFIQNSNDISDLFWMAHEFDPDIFRELEKGTLANIAKNDQNVFLFRNSMMEELQNEESKAIFGSLKKAIHSHSYRDIYYHYNEALCYHDAKPIKLVFMDNNWYVAFIDSDRYLRFARLSFITEIKKRASQGSFQGKEIEPYLAFLAEVQNSMTLYGVETRHATIRATPKIAKYFDQGMKRFLPSQEFLEKQTDGSVLFRIAYTQELEVLPFIQRWLPDLIIVEPESLRYAYQQKLQTTLQNHLN